MSVAIVLLQQNRLLPLFVLVYWTNKVDWFVSFQRVKNVMYINYYYYQIEGVQNQLVKIIRIAACLYFSSSPALTRKFVASFFQDNGKRFPASSSLKRIKTNLLQLNASKQVKFLRQKQIKTQFQTTKAIHGLQSPLLHCAIELQKF